MVADESTPPGYVKLHLVQRDAPILVKNYQDEEILTDRKRRSVLEFVSSVPATHSTVNLNALILSHGLKHGMGNLVRSLCFSGLGSRLTSQSLEHDIPNQENLTMAHELLLLGTTSDVASGHLKLAAFYLALNNLDILEDVLNHVDAMLT
ncbi:hypothetical protein CHS0354_007605 [Potamilus streckersoni]|uniref:Uncharacterized protein n=1 Tax=Potamilus streckersoni TaxID=2493646 RepID=A0AAE0T4M1_9BIVA|nr:hypothetical protein CHS0354_007605 [Potamilus streckersoni]